jgi:hypothetical protein
MDTKTAPVTEEEVKEIEENAEHLKKVLKTFENQHAYAGPRRARLEALMKRKITRKWKPEKTAKMVRRLIAAGRDDEQAVNAIDHIKHRLEQLGRSDREADSR